MAVRHPSKVKVPVRFRYPAHVDFMIKIINLRVHRFLLISIAS